MLYTSRHHNGTKAMSTTDDIVSRVRADLQRAQSSAEKARLALAAWEGEVSELTIFLRTLERYAGPTQKDIVIAAPREHDKNDKVIPAHGTNSRVLVDACIDAIQHGGRPLTIGDLVDVCIAQGLKIGGKDLKSNLAGYLSRDPRVKSLGRNIGWAIAETEGAASAPASQEAAPSLAAGGSNDRPTLAFPDEFVDLVG